MKKLLTIIIVLFVVGNLYSQSCFDPVNVYTFEYNGIKYDIVKENKKWLDAAYCADLMGGILTEINSEEEQDTIFFHLNQAGIDPAANVAPDGGNASYIWIGGNDLAEEGKWIWDGSNDGIGDQFWQGTKTGNAVGGLYNNWGNEPDNFGGQDGLGLAITNWPFGKAGQWNDISTDNSLFFVIEYDNSTIPLKGVNYSYDDNTIVATANLSFDFDSLQILVDENVCTTLHNINKEDSIFVCPYEFSEITSISTRLFAFRENMRAVSQIRKLELFKKIDPVNSYATDFEETPTDDFMGEGFEIKREFGFSTKAIHSIHNYEIRNDYTYTLLRPIVIDALSSSLSFSDVAIIEPGEEGSTFGDNNFNDYVIVEGSENLEEWIPISNGYDARMYPDWLDAWNSGAQYKKLYKKQFYDLASVFEEGDTILIRFRLHSDDKITGWGWTIDSLSIQPIGSAVEESTIYPGSFELRQNYPNPFNPTTTISYSIAEKSEVSINVFDVLGRHVETIVDKQQNPGIYTVSWNASQKPSGVYFYKIVTNNFSKVKRMLLLK